MVIIQQNSSILHSPNDILNFIELVVECFVKKTKNGILLKKKNHVKRLFQYSKV